MTSLLRLARSEWHKLRSSPTMWWLLVGTVVLTAGVTVGGFMVADIGHLPQNTGKGLQEGLHAVGVGTTMAEIAAIIGMAGEFRFGQADQTFLSEPRRGRVVAAKTVVYGALGVVFGLVSSMVTLAGAWIWLTAKGIGLPFGQSLLWSTLGGAVASAGLCALLGVAVGAALRNQVVAIVTILGVQVIVETSVFQASSSFGRWLPGQASGALRKLPTDGLLPAGTAVVVLAVWVAVILALGVTRTFRSDIT